MSSKGQYKCLIANDDHFQMIGACYNLRHHNIEILLQGCNGLEIFQYIKKNPNQKIDLILLDLEMPIMNGYEACKQIEAF